LSPGRLALALRVLEAVGAREEVLGVREGAGDGLPDLRLDLLGVLVLVVRDAGGVALEALERVLALGLRGEGFFAYWAASTGAAHELARRLHLDRRLRRPSWGILTRSLSRVCRSGARDPSAVASPAARRTDASLTVPGTRTRTGDTTIFRRSREDVEQRGSPISS
jgi:hypothetical protein